YGSYMDGSWSRWLSQGPSSEIPGEEDQVGPCEQLDALSPFNPLIEMRQNKRKGRKIHGPTPSSPPRRNYEITPRAPSAARGHGPTIEPCSIFNKWNALAVRSQVGQ
ncbi:hypothetical protein M569_00252, partial [Genlisea aurea]